MGLNTAAIHALWTLHGLDKMEEAMPVVQKALAHDSPAVRKAAIQVLADTDDATMYYMEANVLQDTNLNTRLAAVLSALDQERTPSLEAAIKKATEGGDTWIAAAVATLDPPAEQEETPMMASQNGSLPMAHLTINANPEMMTFQQESLQAYAGQPIRLTFNNLHPEFAQCSFTGSRRRCKSIWRSPECVFDKSRCNKQRLHSPFNEGQGAGLHRCAVPRRDCDNRYRQPASGKIYVCLYCARPLGNHERSAAD